jgi:hypothetical protein
MYEGMNEYVSYSNAEPNCRRHKMHSSAPLVKIDVDV